MLLQRHRIQREQSEAARLEALRAENKRAAEEAQNLEVAAVQGSVAESPEPKPASTETAEPKLPSTNAELQALDLAGLRALAASLDIEIDGRWGIAKVRQVVAEELGL